MPRQARDEAGTERDKDALDEAANTITLSLSDLMPDRTGAVVIQSDGENLTVVLTDYDGVKMRGIAPDGIFAEQGDISGFDFITFSSGVTVYFDAGTVRLRLASTRRGVAPRPVILSSMTELIERELGGEGGTKSRSGPETGRRLGA